MLECEMRILLAMSLPGPWACVKGGRLTLFRLRTSPNPTNGWSALADEPVEVHEMAVDHYSMLVPPAVAGLADRLRSCIERSLAFVPQAPEARS
jgi:thioesterase domain-containing protein